MRYVVSIANKMVCASLYHRVSDLQEGWESSWLLVVMSFLWHSLAGRVCSVRSKSWNQPSITLTRTSLTLIIFLMAACESSLWKWPFRTNEDKAPSSVHFRLKASASTEATRTSYFECRCKFSRFIVLRAAFSYCFTHHSTRRTISAPHERC